MATLAYATEVLTEGVEYFDPEEYLINVVRRAAANRQDVLVDGSELGELVILGSRHQYVAHTEDISRLCAAHAACFTVRLLAEQEQAQALKGRPARDLHELLWHTAFHASAGRLMEGCFRDDVVQLDRWPNLTRLPRTPHTLQLCALFSRHPTSITLAGRLVGAERGELFQFYSAARCAGVARSVNRAAEEPRLEPYRNKTLLSQLFGRIAGL